jgi:hypothetical protein
LLLVAEGGHVPVVSRAVAAESVLLWLWVGTKRIDPVPGVRRSPS